MAGYNPGVQYSQNYGFNSGELYEPYKQSASQAQQQQDEGGSGAAKGAAAGSMAGPWGALIGAGVGYITDVQKAKIQEEMARRSAQQGALMNEQQMRKQAMDDIMKAYSVGLMR